VNFITSVFAGDWQSAWDSIVGIFSSVWETMKAIFTEPINFIIDGLNKFITYLNKIQIPDWVPGVGGKGLNIPTIPKLERGGILEAGQVGLLEGSGAEAVVPLENNKAWVSAVAAALRSAMQSEGVLGPGGSGGVINYNFNQVNNSPKALDRLAIYRDTQNLINLTKGARA
jgi:hypothetical protein